MRGIGDLTHRVLPHFDEYPLQSSKQNDVERFNEICQLVYRKHHLDVDGLEQIVSLAMDMNPSGKRKYSGSEILNSLRSGEGIVCATGNRGTNTK